LRRDDQTFQTRVADLLITYGCSDITLVNSQGIITSERAELTDEKKRLAASTNPRKTQGGLAEALVGADVFIGVSKAGLLTQDMIKSMRPGPIVFALANPVPEIMPDLALEAGALVVATGRSDFPNQINNVLAFPGIFRGALDNGVTKITDLMFLNAAQNLASLVENPTAGEILPSLFDADVVLAVATAIKA
jgi:malate dehydrogenase (oxaloacetate-decarboxylating)